MAESTKSTTTSAEDTPALILAEFDTPAQIMHAAEKFRDAGYTAFDTHTPFPVHGMDAAMGMKDSKLGAIVFPIGLTGTTLAWLMMWWMNGVDYPLVIGGKPPYSLPSMIPIMFEQVERGESGEPSGINVLYMDGHVSFVKWPANEFPITKVHALFGRF